MKKTILVVASVLALAVAPMFADVAFSGDAEFGFSSNFDDSVDGVSQFDIDDVDLDVKAAVDEFTTVIFDITLDDAFPNKDYSTSNADDSTGDIYSSEFEVITNVTGALGLELPFSVKLTAGYNDDIGAKAYDANMLLQTADYNGDRDPDIATTVGTFITYKDITIQASIDPLIFTTDGTTKDMYSRVPGSFIGAYGTVGPVTAEAYYDHNCKKNIGSSGKSAYLDTLGLTSKTKVDLGSDDMSLLVGFGVTYDMISDYGVAASGYADDVAGLNISAQPKFSYKNITTAVGFAYSKTLEKISGVEYDDSLAMSYEINYKLTDVFTLEGGIVIADLMSDADLEFDDYGTNATDDGYANAAYRFDVAASMGKATWKLGYQSSSVYCDYFDGVDLDEGVFMECKVKY
jgi:hypothetical protein